MAPSASHAPVYATILVTDAGPVGRVTLNRPDKRNPIGPTTCGELVHALAALQARPEIRVVILTGAGPVFSAGGDLGAMAGGALAGAGGGEIAPASLVDLLLAMHGLGKPIIAMVNGPALAGGLGLMVACDLVVAADTATFGTTEIAVGLWPMMITAEITRSVGRKRTLDMMLTGRKLDAAEALACGLVTRVVPAGELEAATLALAGELAERSPAAVALGLQAFYRAQDLELEPQLRYLEGELGRVLALDDAREGIAAFLGKRKPVWTGK
jgi:enoyl-CoA hydratase/carnithine racemase